MLDLLLEPTALFVKGGIDAFRTSKEHHNLLIAVQDRIRREVKFNTAILQEFMKYSNDSSKDEYLCLTLLKALQTEAFDEINRGVLPLSIFFEKKSLKSDFPNWQKKETEQFFKWMENIESQYDLLERVYHRIKLAQTFAEGNRLQGNMRYIQFMLIGLQKSIANTELKAIKQ
ncbi:hypothetical protein QUF74_05190 [Candidatus Halobeggiatoa sp. HSG11]|nr:hypothetical protein [Candidatus Halobeggiatoa sp. HSG11]